MLTNLFTKAKTSPHRCSQASVGVVLVKLGRGLKILHAVSTLTPPLSKPGSAPVIVPQQLQWQILQWLD